MERMTAEELAGLKAVAMAATPGPWEWGGTECTSQEQALAICKENLEATAKPGAHFCEVFLEDGRRTALVGNGPTGIENAAFIAAANPSTILRLVEQAGRVEGLEAECQSLSNLVGEQDKALAAMEASQLDAPAPPEVAVEQQSKDLPDLEDLNESQKHNLGCMDSWARAEGMPTYSSLYLAATQYNDLLRKICFEYGAGGYNSEGLMSPAVAESKIRFVIDEERRVGKDLASPAVPVAEGLPASADLQAIKVAMDHMGDALNEIDAVEDDDLAITYPGFNAIDRLIAAAAAAAPALPVVPEGTLKLLKDIAEWMASSVNCQQACYDEPPDYASQFDYDLAQASDEIKSIVSQLAAAPVLPVEQPSQPLDKSDVMPLFAEPASQHNASDSAAIDVRYEFERWMSGMGESTQYIGDGLYSDGTVQDQAEAFAAGVALASGFREGKA